MKSIFQDDEYECGVACVAMLRNLTLPRARLLCGADFENGIGITVKGMLRIIERAGMFVAARGLITLKHPVTNLHRNALLWGKQLPSRGTIDADKNVFDHWLVWDAKLQVVRDPYRYRKAVRLTRYFELDVPS